MIFRKMQEVISYIWRIKIIWFKPKKTKVLIYDRIGSDILSKCLDLTNFQILDLRGESLNISVLLKALFDFRKLSLRLKYVKAYISIVDPAFIITFMDNKKSFYELKDVTSKFISVFIQNGIRSEIADVFGVLEKESKAELKRSYAVDYMLVFGNVIGKKYSQYISGKIFPVGSLLNNYCSIVDEPIPATILFLSQFRSPDNKEQILWIEGNENVYWKELFSAETFIIPLLAEYCKKKKLKLKICASSYEEEGDEFQFYKSLIGDSPWEFLVRSDRFTSYKNLDKAEFVVFIDSTLGYEALARGKKTAAFCVRSFLEKEHPYPFGWPAILPDNGQFWTNDRDAKRIEQVLDYITKVSQKEWEEIRLRYIPELMEYDIGNTKLIQVMKDIGLPIRSDL